MSINDRVEPTPVIYGADPDARLTDVVSSTGSRIDPTTNLTLINDSVIPLTLNMSGPQSTVVKDIKLINGIGAVILTTAGTIVLDGDNTEVNVVYDSVLGVWLSVPPGMVIPITQRTDHLIGSTAASASDGPIDAGAGARHTLALSASGEFLAMGGPGTGNPDIGFGVGTVWIFQRDGIEWKELFALVTTLVGTNRLGTSVDTNDQGTTIIASAPLYTLNDANGAAVIYERNDAGKWVETEQITQPDDNIINIGEVVIDGAGTTAVLGPELRAVLGDFTGAAWIYRRNADASWSLLQKLTSEDVTGQYGSSLAISADASTILVAAPWDKHTVYTWSKVIAGVTEISEIVVENSYKLLGGEYFLIYRNGDSIKYYVWIDTGGSTDPAVPDATGIQVDVSDLTISDNVAVAQRISDSINSASFGSLEAETDCNIITVTATTIGDITSPTYTTDVNGGDFATEFEFETLIHGTEYPVIMTVTVNDDTFADGSYFILQQLYQTIFTTIDQPTITFNIWMDNDGSGTPEPTTTGTNVAVDLSAATTKADIATAIAAAVDALADYNAVISSHSDVTVEITRVDDDPFVSISNSTNPVPFCLDNARPASTGEQYTFVQADAPSTITADSYFTLYAANFSPIYSVWMDKDGDNTPDIVPPNTLLQVDISAAVTAADVATAIASAVDGNADFDAVVADDGISVIINTVASDTSANSVDGALPTGFLINTFRSGLKLREESTVDLTGFASGNIKPSSYFTFDDSFATYYVWMNVSGSDTDPAVAGATGIEVDMGGAALSTGAIAELIKDAINASAASVTAIHTPLESPIVIIRNVTIAVVDYIRDGEGSTEFEFSVIRQGTPTGGYTETISPITKDLTRFGYDMSLSADGTVAAITGDGTDDGGVCIYTRSSGDWTLVTTLLANGIPDTINSADINAAGNVVIAGNSKAQLGYVFANTTGTWAQKDGVLTPGGYNAPDVYSDIMFGSDTTISGNGNLGFIGASDARLLENGEATVITIDTGGVGPLVASARFKLELVNATDIYYVWFDTTGADPPPGLGGVEIKIAVDDLTLPDDDEIVATRIGEAITAAIPLSLVTVASVVGTVVTLNATVSGESTAIDVAPKPTGFAFATPVNGSEPPITGAAFPFA